MKLTVLGCDGGWPGPGGAASGYLLRDDGFNLWLDCGPGSMATLLQHIGLTEIGAVAISHEHGDHFLDLYMHFVGRYYDPECSGAQVPVFAPPGLREKALALQPDLLELFDWHDIAPGETIEAGPFHIATAEMLHPVPTLGMRIATNGSTLAYSADTGPTDALVDLARDADTLLAEATWYGKPEGRIPLHLSGHEAGEHASRAGVGRLIVTHVWPTYDRRLILEHAAKAFDGPTTLAQKGLTVSL